MANVTFEIKNLNKVLKGFEKFGEKGDLIVSEVTKATALEIAGDAKQIVPRDTGKLAQSITPAEITPKLWSITAGGLLAPYAAYVEFGTGRLTQVPEELKAIANTFRGKGIREVNLRPRPYLHPAFVVGRREYLIDLTKMFDKLIKRENREGK